MNAQYLGDWDVAPRGHPNDGKIDVFEGDLGLLARWQVRDRLRTGTHLPNPEIEERHAPAVQIDLDRPTPIRLDGEDIGPARSLSIRLEVDALRCWV